MSNFNAPGLAAAVRDMSLVDALADLASAAGAIIMPYLHDAAPEWKSDGSPVTAADSAAESLILEELHTLLPGVPVVSEEAASAGRIPTIGSEFVLVDALDGTKEFIAGSDHFTVNIALIRNAAPVAGFVYAPALQQLWLGAERAETMTVAPGQKVRHSRARSPIRVRPFPRTGCVAVSSLRHANPETEAFLARLPVARHERAGSSLKFCRLAEGRADVYPRFSPTMEWDTAAGDAIVRAAGGVVVTPDGVPFAYGKAAQEFRNGPFVATSDWSGMSQVFHAD